MLTILVVLAVWIVLQAWVLPRLGVPHVSGALPARAAGVETQAGRAVKRGRESFLMWLTKKTK